MATSIYRKIQKTAASPKATTPGPCLQAAAGPCLEEVPAQYRGFPQEYEELSGLPIRLWLQEDTMIQSRRNLSLS